MQPSHDRLLVADEQPPCLRQLHRPRSARPLDEAFSFFFFNDPAPTEIYTLSDTLSLHDALPISAAGGACLQVGRRDDRRGPSGGAARSEEHTSELQSPLNISYAVFCLKKQKIAVTCPKRTVRPRPSIGNMGDLAFFFLMIRRPPRSTR